MDAISQTTFANAFYFNANVRVSLKISLRFLPKVRINNIPALVQMMAWRRPGEIHYMKPGCPIHWRIYASRGLNMLIWLKWIFSNGVSDFCSKHATYPWISNFMQVIFIYFYNLTLPNEKYKLNRVYLPSNIMKLNLLLTVMSLFLYNPKIIKK